MTVKPILAGILCGCVAAGMVLVKPPYTTVYGPYTQVTRTYTDWVRHEYHPVTVDPATRLNPVQSLICKYYRAYDATQWGTSTLPTWELMGSRMGHLMVLLR